MALVGLMQRLKASARLHETKLRFLIVGGINTLFGVAIFPVLMITLEPLGWNYLSVLIVSNAIAINFSYMTNKYFVFQTKGGVFDEYVKFISFHGIYFIVNLIALPLIIYLSNMSPIWSQISFVLFTLVASFVWHSRITFSRRNLNHD